MDRGENASRGREKMGHENQRRFRPQLQALPDFRLMPVLAYAVGLEISEQLGEGKSHFGLLARTGDSALGVANDRLVVVEQMNDGTDGQQN